MKSKSSIMNSLILDEACEWFVEFRAGDIDASLRQRFDEWLRRSPEHIRAYIDIARIYVEVPPPDPTGEIDLPAHEKCFSHGAVVKDRAVVSGGVDE